MQLLERRRPKYRIPRSPERASGRALRTDESSGKAPDAKDTFCTNIFMIF